MNLSVIWGALVLLISNLISALASIDPLRLNCLILYDESRVSLIQLYLHDSSTALIPLTLSSSQVVAITGEISNNLLEIYYSTVQEEFGIVIIDEVETYEKKIHLKSIGMFAKQPVVSTVYYFDEAAGLSSSSLDKPKAEVVSLDVKDIMYPLFFENELLYLLSKSGSNAKVTAVNLEKKTTEKEYELNLLPYRVWIDFQRNDIFAATANEIHYAKLNASQNMGLIYQQLPLGLERPNYVDVAIGMRNLYLVNSTDKVYRIFRRNFTLKTFASQEDDFSVISRVVLIQDRRNGTVMDFSDEEEKEEPVRIIPKKTTPKIIIPQKPKDEPFGNVQPQPQPIRAGSPAFFNFGGWILWTFVSWLSIVLEVICSQH